jgi:serine protease Do
MNPARALILSAAILSLSTGCAKTRPASTRPAAFPDATPDNVMKVTQAIFPAVVRLDIAQESFSQGRRQLQRGIGSGVIIDDQGRILTNYHVAGRAAEIYITLYNKERIRATLIGDDHWTDLALVQLDMAEVKRKNITFSAAPLGDSDKLVVGQPVMAIGTPFGLTRTTTLGIVSNNERTFYPEKETIGEFETGEFNNWIQMDTPIAPGNSGGPLVDLSGKVVGINTRGIPSAGGLNFAIPINTAKGVIAQILATAQTATLATTNPATGIQSPATTPTTPATPAKLGRVTRSDLGIDLKPTQDLEAFFDIDPNKGVLVNSVARMSPAAKAGLQAQDILLSVNDHPMNVRFPEEIVAARSFISALPVGSEVTVKIRRGKQDLTLTMKTDKLEGAVGEEREIKTWGITVRDVTRTYANESQLDDDKGVVITTLASGQPAQKAELQRGDVIRSVNQQPAHDLEAFLRLYDAALAAGDKAILIEFVRGRTAQRAVLRPN